MESDSNHIPIDINLRLFNNTDEAKEPKKGKSPFLDPSVLVAFITVLLGGLFGSVITGIFQAWTKDREVAQAFLKLENEMRIADFKEYSMQQKTTTKRAFDLINTTINSADKVIYLTDKRWMGKTGPVALRSKSEIITEFNSNKTKWNIEKKGIGELLGYYYVTDKNANTSVEKAWYSLSKSIDSFIYFSEHFYIDNKNGNIFFQTEELEKKALGPNKSVLTAVDSFKKEISLSRIYLWKSNYLSKDAGFINNDPINWKYAIVFMILIITFISAIFLFILMRSFMGRGE